MIIWNTLEIPLAELHQISRWHLEHALDHPIEHQLWDVVLSAWLMGWLGWLPTWILDAWWAGVPCMLGILTPKLYVGWRTRARALNRLRCDWLP